MEPVTIKERISVIDSLRGMALLGILMMNMPFFSGPHQYHFDLSIRNEFSGPNYWSWWVVYGLFEGTMRGTFSMLFGAGSLLLLERLQSRNTGLYPADIYYRRLLILILFGMFNAFILNWAGDILFSYGVCGLFLFPFRNLRPAGLVSLGIGCLLVMTVLATFHLRELVEKKEKGIHAIALEKKGASLTDQQTRARESWQKYLDKRKPENQQKEIAETIEDMQGSYFHVMGTLAPWNIKFESIKLYKEMFWDAIGFFLIGMALFRWNVLTGRRSVRFYLIMAALGLSTGLSLNYYTLRTVLDVNFDWVLLAERIPIPLYQLKRLLMTSGNIGLFIAIYKAGWLGFLFRWLAKVGQMAFSNYLGQSIICTLIFYGYGFGYFGKLERYQTYEVVIAIWVFQVIFSNIWLRYFRFGPFEWVWRSLTYWQRQPMVRPRKEQEVL